MKKKWQVVALKSLLGVLGAIVGLLVVVEIVLSPAVATRLVNKYAPEFIDADLTFGKAGISVFRNFPNISVRLNDAVLTYPHDRYAAFEDNAADPLMYEGRNEAADTLACFESFTGAVSVPALLVKTVKVKRVELTHPRVFAKMYDSENVNWNIFKSSGEEKETEDTTEMSLKLNINKVRLAEQPHIVFCMPEDSLYANLDLREMVLRGKLALTDLPSSHGSFLIDELAVNGRYRKDTLLFGLERLGLEGSRNNFSLDAKATAYASTRGYGQLTVPFSIDAKASYPQDSIPVVHVKSLDANVAGIPLEASGDAILYSDRYNVDAAIAMRPIPVGDLIREYGSAFWSDAGRIESNSKIYFTADVKGDYVLETKELPGIDASLSIPESYVKYEGVDQAVDILLDATAKGGAGKPVNLNVKTCKLSSDGLDFNADADVKDMLGKDPDIRLDAKLLADVAKAIRVLPSDIGIRAEGDIDAELSAKALLSQLNINRIGKADVKGRFDSDCLAFEMPKDTLSADVDGLSINVGVTANQFDESMAGDARVLMLSAVADTLNADFKGMFIRMGKFKLDAQNSADILSDMELSMTNVRPFCGYNEFGSIKMRDADSTVINVHDLKDRFYMRPKNGNRNVPELYATVGIGRTLLRSDANLVLVRDVNATVDAAMNSVERSHRVSKLRDSLARVYPDVPKDSLLNHARAQRRRPRGEGQTSSLPEWLQDEDFRAKDINLKLTGNLAKYFREWDVNGSFNLRDAQLVTPYLPLKNNISKASATFSNDKVELKNITAKSGSSDLSISGSLTNLKKALRGRGEVNLDLRVKSNQLNANELLSALDKGSQVTEKDIDSRAKLSDSDFEEAVVMTDLADSAVAPSLIVVPGNIVANVFLDANRIQYSTLDFDWVQAEIMMKERCLQLTNMIAMSNVGNVYCEAFYSTKSKQDIQTGITLDLQDITAERVIEIVPAVDSLVPLLKSFSGLLNCSVAATTSLDEDMNILFPTLKGVVRISGSDLLVDDLGDLKKIAKLLMFKNKNQLFVDHMQVDGLIGNSQVEIFPFVLDIDRYKLALSGIQNLDKSFKYHISVMKWPLLFKFGIDLRGDFENFKFSLGKAKYRRAAKVPDFENVIDDSKTNLRGIIHNIFKKSVDRAVADYNVQQMAQDYKESVSYVSAADIPLESLDDKNASLFEKLGEVSEFVDLEHADFDKLDSLQLVKLDSLGVSARDLKKMAEEFSE